MEIEIINALTRWNDEGILSGHYIPTSGSVSLNEKRIIVPTDFVELYKKSDGTSDYDSEGFRFYKHGELTTMENKFALNVNSPLKEIVIFADYMQESCWYGFRINTNGYEIGLIPEANRFKVLCNSLYEFLNLYLTDSPHLYDYN